jgi:hypothetical protein
MSVNKTATQNVWQHHFPEPGGRRGVMWEKLAHRGSGSNTVNFMKIMDSSCDKSSDSSEVL